MSPGDENELRSELAWTAAGEAQALAMTAQCRIVTHHEPQGQQKASAQPLPQVQRHDSVSLAPWSQASVSNKASARMKLAGWSTEIDTAEWTVVD